MLDTIEQLARLSVARACAFAALAIGTVMIGCSWDLILALRAGGVLALTAAAVLTLKGIQARQRPYKHTELWLMLPTEQRPRAEVAQQLIGTALREVYFRFAEHTAAIAAGMLLLSLVASLASAGR